jgi:hypothetical protein
MTGNIQSFLAIPQMNNKGYEVRSEAIERPQAVLP